MSVSNYIISDRAKEDLVEIYDRSLDLWGKQKTDEYIQKIHKKCLMVCNFPHMGVKRKGRRNNIRFVLSGSHSVFYTIHESEIFILRILHQKMNTQDFL
jgi:toxin ParE1/3/4